jgi:hypothetical protein
MTTQNSHFDFSHSAAGRLLFFTAACRLSFGEFGGDATTSLPIRRERHDARWEPLRARSRSASRACAVLTGPLTSVKEQAVGAYAAALSDRGFWRLRLIIARSAKVAVSRANLKIRSPRSKT